MNRYVLTPDAAIRLAEQRAALRDDVEILAPTLLRSQLLAELYRQVAAGERARADADPVPDVVRGFTRRFLGDRVLQQTAWKVADQLGMADTLDAEYIALTILQADALVTLDAQLAKVAATRVRVAPLQELVA